MLKTQTVLIVQPSQQHQTEMANSKVYIFLIFLCLQDSVVQGKVIDFSKNSKLQKYLEVHRCRQECYAKVSGKLNNFIEFLLLKLSVSFFTDP